MDWSDTESNTEDEPAPNQIPENLLVTDLPESDHNYDYNSEDSNYEDNEEMPIGGGFDAILEQLGKEWILIEMTHSVSKKASEMFWKLGRSYFPDLIRLKEASKTSKIPSFTHLRRRLVKSYCPDVSIDVAYRNSETGEVCIKDDLRKLPVTKYRKPAYEPLYEIASVKVKINNI